MLKWFNISSQARFSVHDFKSPPSLQGRKFAAIFSLKVLEVLKYKESLCQWMYKERGKSLTFLILLLVIYKKGYCVHLRLLTAVEYNFAGDMLHCNGTVALIF
jgi:hypothetical protein